MRRSTSSTSARAARTSWSSSSAGAQRREPTERRAAGAALLTGDSRVLSTTSGDLALQEYRLRLAGREWSVLHTGAVLSLADEARFLEEQRDRVPYGAVLWPAAIALAHELAARADSLRGARVLELGAGTGLPGIVAASLGAHVVQTDRHPVALAMCARNAERNHVTGIECRLADWGEWTDVARYGLIVGSDILYAESKHENLRAIIAANLAPGGRVLIADPLRPMSVRFLEAIDRDGWTIGFSKWNVGEPQEPRQVAIYDLAREQ